MLNKSLSRYELSVSAQRNGERKSVNIHSLSASDNSAIAMAHAVADALEFFGCEKIEIGLRSESSRNVAIVSDLIDDDRSLLQRQHTLCEDYRP
jgi:hypothetical protein